MTEGAEHPRGVHLVGSVPLDSAEAVFRTVSDLVGRYVRRIPDGETGERIQWVGWQFPRFSSRPQLELGPPVSGSYGSRPKFRLRPGCSADDVHFDDLGYAAAARASYTTFAALQQAGVIPAHCRFQVSLPTPLAPVVLFAAPELHAALEPAYEAQLLSEVRALLAAIPPARLALQWDVAVEVSLLEGVPAWQMPAAGDDVRAGIIARLIRLGDAIPPDVELGYHLCYGDYQHRPFAEPADARLVTELANAVAAGLGRPLSWLHLPVPRERTDAAFFAPLSQLALAAETELYLGLVHLTDGLAGTQQRIAAAQRVAPPFGVATACGLGRRPAETIPALLRLHAAVANPVC